MASRKPTYDTSLLLQKQGRGSLHQSRVHVTANHAWASKLKAKVTWSAVGAKLGEALLLFTSRAGHKLAWYQAAADLGSQDGISGA
eukprot:923840-Pelagomonas_calceolata.AAC.2